jgi:hypothetical protein
VPAGVVGVTGRIARRLIPPRSRSEPKVLAGCWSSSIASTRKSWPFGLARRTKRQRVRATTLKGPHRDDDQETLKHIEQFVRRHLRRKRGMLEKWLAVTAMFDAVPTGRPTTAGVLT